MKKENYEFLGWYLEGEKFDFSTPIMEDIKLFARWEEGTEFSDHGFQYKVLTDTEVEIIGYDGRKTDTLIIPDKIGAYTVTSIEEGAFDALDDFTGSLILPEGLTSIGSAAFLKMIFNCLQA